jgi:hypothetical protein
MDKNYRAIDRKYWTVRHVPFRLFAETARTVLSEKHRVREQFSSPIHVALSYRRMEYEPERTK